MNIWYKKIKHQLNPMNDRIFYSALTGKLISDIGQKMEDLCPHILELSRIFEVRQVPLF
jgi:hypothetical protein